MSIMVFSHSVHSIQGPFLYDYSYRVRLSNISLQYLFSAFYVPMRRVFTKIGSKIQQLVLLVETSRNGSWKTTGFEIMRSLKVRIAYDRPVASFI